MIVDKIKKRETKNIRPTNKVDIPVGKWIKCEACKEILYKENVKENNSVCPLCGHSFRLSSRRRIDQIIDKDTFKEFKLNIDVADNVKKELEKINFNEDKFLKGAENAVEMINDSFSNKDLETLKELLTTQVYNNFKKQIDELNNQNRILKSSLISFLSNKIDNIVVKNKNINIDVLFEMEQINFVEDKDGNIIMGSKKKIQKVKEKWTFEKKAGDKTNFWLIKNIENITK